VAVLPFKNLVTDTNKFYFADMLTEEIIAKLGEMSANKNSVLKKVPSAPMMMTYKATTLSPGAIARELSVDCLVAGSVAVSGTQASIRVQLIEGAQDTLIWSTNYVGDVDHIIRLRNEVPWGYPGHPSCAGAGRKVAVGQCPPG
jgi:TolB-like protein